MSDVGLSVKRAPEKINQHGSGSFIPGASIRIHDKLDASRVTTEPRALHLQFRNINPKP